MYGIKVNQKVVNRYIGYLNNMKESEHISSSRHYLCVYLKKYTHWFWEYVSHIDYIFRKKLIGGIIFITTFSSLEHNSYMNNKYYYE